MPLLLVIFWMYFLLPALFGKIPETQTVIIALTMFTSAYMSRIVVAGVEGIPKGQPFQAMFYIVLPQGLRNMIPSFVNQFVSLIKDTSLAFIVGVSELTHVGPPRSTTVTWPFPPRYLPLSPWYISCSASPSPRSPAGSKNG